MSIFAEIEKLISEHGSAAILREKVGLLEVQRAQAIGERDKMSALQAEKDSKVKSLEGENANLRAKLQKAREEVERLKQPNKPSGAWGSRKKINF